MKPWRHYMYEPHCTLLLTKEWIKIQINKNKEININPSRYYVNWTRLLLTGIIPVSSLVYFNTRIFKVSVLNLICIFAGFCQLCLILKNLILILCAILQCKHIHVQWSLFHNIVYFAMWSGHKILFLQHVFGKIFNSCFIWCIITVIVNKMCNIYYHKTQRTQNLSLLFNNKAF